MAIIEKTILVPICPDVPECEYIEEHILKAGIDPIRWAIVSVEGGNYVVSAAGVGL